jgi:diaminopimelate epimerase
MQLIKSHAFGNDFLLIDTRELSAVGDRPGFAREVCDRHRGIGADGLIAFQPRRGGASMHLLNADGSRSEVSGNGVRCLAAWLALEQGLAGGAVEIETEAGVKRLAILEIAGGRYTFRAAMGQPEEIARESIDVGGTPVDAITLRVGNPQCVVLGEVTEARLHGLASRLAVHPRFTAGTNVELATVVAPDHVRILIWERGVGPTESSGTGSCASAVAAAFAGGAARDVEVIAPGGSQRVEWDAQNTVWLTGWAEVVLRGRWLRPAGA